MTTDSSQPRVLADNPAAFLEHFLRVIAESRRTTTYKLLLVLALLDAVKLTEPKAGEPTRLRLRYVAERAVHLLWWQVAPYRGEQLQQKSKGQAKIVERVGALRKAAPGGSMSGLRRMVGGEELLDSVVRAVTWDLAWWPVPRLQNVLDGTIEFLYPVHPQWLQARNDKVPDRTYQLDHERLPVIDLFPGVADLLLRTGSLLRPHLEDTWTLQLARWNRLQDDPEISLRRHLFPGSERSALPRQVRQLLHDLQSGSCFWCRRPIGKGGGHVDHVVPWIESRNDALENLVLADPSCNESKLQWLVSPRLLERYLEYLRQIHQGLDGLAAEANWYSDASYSVSVLHSSYASLPGGVRRVWEVGEDRKASLVSPDLSELDHALRGIRGIRDLLAG